MEPASPAVASGFFSTEPPGKPNLGSEQGTQAPGESGYALLFDHMEEQLIGKVGQQGSELQKVLHSYL